MQADLNIGGPHNPEYTRQVAAAVAEGIWVLNYATFGTPAPGLEYPQDAHDLLAHLVTATQRLPQLLRQITAFLDSQSATGRLADDHRRDPAARIVTATGCLLTASQLADDQLLAALTRARDITAGLYVKEDVDG